MQGKVGASYCIITAIYMEHSYNYHFCKRVLMAVLVTSLTFRRGSLGKILGQTER